jgi:hypothetical protein
MVSKKPLDSSGPVRAGFSQGPMPYGHSPNWPKRILLGGQGSALEGQSFFRPYLTPLQGPLGPSPKGKIRVVPNFKESVWCLNVFFS